MNTRLIRRLPLLALLLVLSAGLASAQTYWFETYESAVDKIEAEEREEMEDALAVISNLLADRPLPESRIRVPGDRYVDYLPYFQQAPAIQMMLGDYDEARRSLDKSEAFPAIQTNKQAMTALREMRSSLNRVSTATP